MTTLPAKEKAADLEASSPYSVADVDTLDVNVASSSIVLTKSFNLFSACATGITTGNAWAVLGGAIIASLYNGGPPGIIYELYAFMNPPMQQVRRSSNIQHSTVVSFFYCFVGASIAELASSIPASGGVYHWATVTAGPRYGRICGWFAGWLNALAWTFAVASNTVMTSNMIVYAYSLYHSEFNPQRWHIFICYLIMLWICCFTVMFAQPALAAISRLGSFFIVAGLLITTIVCAIMPSRNGSGYASNDFVWRDWNNLTGYSSDALTFLAGMLNGAFAVGAIDCVTHIAEEIPQAEKNIPKALACQVLIGFVTGLCYLVSIFYAINDLPKIMGLNSICPLGDIYLQATGSKAGTAVTTRPHFSSKIGAVSPRWHSPLWATFACGIFLTFIGAIYVGSLTAFNAFIGSFVVLTTASYLLAIFPHLLTNRKNIRPGPFWMGKYGAMVNVVACSYIVVTFVIYCFPYSVPTSPESMNYTSVITCGLIVLVGVWWLVHGKSNFHGPQITMSGQ
ncbi:uncharacterized protein N7477_008614 [Penicillium maclennaniae]|uniref:uncharacterized protein n=1 Tax=Penicillium maclennaniae TaxID=1343394 RepID=UPI002540576B|nr:uncharacterized protein N7477_008614 [Penicillium maclennaniae]KAJ5666166.1 hypothetical protein N7477_008614 [Penicillium maclennaniae]